jgi:hypothetical protein
MLESSMVKDYTNSEIIPTIDNLRNDILDREGLNILAGWD